MDDRSAEARMLQHACEGDARALNDLWQRHRDRLCNLVKLRLDHRVRGRVDPSDVIQESYLEAYRRLDEYLQSPTVPFYVWLRFLTLQKMAQLHRQHLGVKARAADREISFDQPLHPETTSALLAAQLVGKLTSPSHAVMKIEMKARLKEALEQMAPIDREVLILRHFEQLTNRETADVLGLSEPAACNRHVRALEKLRKALTPG